MDPLVVGPLLGDARHARRRRPQTPSSACSKCSKSRKLLHCSPTSSASAEQALARRPPPLLPRHAALSPLDADNQIELWHWDDATKKLTAARFPLDEARTIWMARLARELARLRPDNRDYERYALALDLEAAAARGD